MTRHKDAWSNTPKISVIRRCGRRIRSCPATSSIHETVSRTVWKRLMAGETAQLRALAALPEDLGLTPSTHPVVYNSSPRGFAAFFQQRQAMPTCDPWTYKQMPIHVKYYSKKCKNLSIGNKIAQTRKDSSVGELPGLTKMMFVFYFQNLEFFPYALPYAWVTSSMVSCLVQLSSRWEINSRHCCCLWAKTDICDYVTQHKILQEIKF